MTASNQLMLATLALATLWAVAACGEAANAPYDPSAVGQQIPEVLAALTAGEPEAALLALSQARSTGDLQGLDHYEAVAHLDAGQPAEALLALQRELTAHPGNGSAQLLMAEALLDMGRVAEAPAHLELATQLLGESPYLSLVSGRVSLALDDDPGARRHLLAYVASDPFSPRAAEAHHGLSQIARRMGQLELAEAEREISAYLEKVNQYLNAYRQRLQESPNDSEAALGVGMTYLDLYQHLRNDELLLEQAERAFLAVLATDTQNSRALYNLGFIATITARTELAHQRYAQTLASDPGHVGALLNDGALSLREGNLEQARTQLLSGLAASKDKSDKVRARLELGRLEESCDAPREAAMQYQAALAVDPEDPRLVGLEDHVQSLVTGSHP
ncbi:MAG: tetratricopeptide (TPR) repeat protein [Pseudohongiellaceae bacterium]|jgi:tetratricopeptide (TPR) repeat protein